MPVNVLVIYDPKGPAIEALAAAAGKGATATGVAEAVLKPVQEATLEDLLAADALMLGAPNWSGVTGTLKLWLDETGDLWEDGSLAGNPAAAFTTGWGRHSGIEMTLLQLIHWLLACGMIVVGLPWTDRMRSSASYYGATATGGVTPEDLVQAEELGARLANVAAKLQSPSNFRIVAPFSLKSQARPVVFALRLFTLRPRCKRGHLLILESLPKPCHE